MKVREAETKTDLPHTEPSPFVHTASEVQHLNNIYAQELAYNETECETMVWNIHQLKPISVNK